MTTEKNEFLVYIYPVCTGTDKELGEIYEYDFIFSESPEIVWGRDWDVYNPSICGDISPEESTYNEVIRVKTTLKLKTIQTTTCYPMEYATYGITALGWIDIENLEEYPENGRMVFHFGDTKEKVAELLSLYDYKL